MRLQWTPTAQRPLLWQVESADPRGRVQGGQASGKRHLKIVVDGVLQTAGGGVRIAIERKALKHDFCQAMTTLQTAPMLQAIRGQLNAFVRRVDDETTLG